MHEDLLCKLGETGEPASRQRAIDEACKGGKEFRLCDVSLAGFDLSGLILVHVPMERTILRGASCRGTRFSRLFDCVLDDADATDSFLPHLHNCRLTHACLRGADIGGRVFGCNFTGAKLCFAQIGPVLPDHRAECGDNRFDDADLHGVDAAGGRLPHSSFIGARLTHARLSRADLSGCDLRSANLTGANITRTCFVDAATTDAVFDECTMTKDQVEELRGACPRQINRPKIVSHVAGLQTARLEKELQAIRDYRIDWHFRPVLPHCGQRIMITNRLSSGELRGYAFQVDSGTFIRMYPMEEEPCALPLLLLDIAADYANWEMDGESVAVRLNPPGIETRILGLLRGILIELFAGIKG